MSRRVWLYAGLFVVAAVGALGAAQELTRADASRMEQKLSAIMARGSVPPRLAKPLRTAFTEQEVNAYFKFNAQTFPTGVVNPRLKIDEGGRLVAFATVDLTAIRKSKDRSFFDPINWVGGSVDLHVAGTVHAQGGMGRLSIASASLGGIPIPRYILQEVIAFYTKSPELPNGFDIDKPFPLPVGIREVQTQRGAAVVVQ